MLATIGVENIGHTKMFLGDKNKKLLKYYRCYNDRFVVRFFLGLTFLLGFFLKFVPFTSRAITNPMEVSGDPSGCTFSSVVTTEHATTIGLGESVTDFGSTKITTLCENSIDHKVFAVGFSDNTSGNTNLINYSNNLTIPTGTGTGNVSNWSMKIAKDTSSYLPANLTIENSFDENHVVPNTTTMVSSYEGGTDSSIGSSILTTYSAKASTTQPGGQYSGKVKFTLTATEIYSRYTITYEENAGEDTVTGMPSPNPEQGIALTSSIYLSEATPTREDYKFLGWSTDSSATTPDYEPSDEYTVAADTDDITLYAIWKYAIFDIIYDANGGDGEMANSETAETYMHSSKKEGDTFDLTYANNYSRDGYGFAGFSPVANAGTLISDNVSSNDPIIFGPNEIVTLPEGFLDYEENGEVKLYAVWVQSQGNLQGWTGCSSMSNGQVAALTDTRDGNTYAIVKIGDNNSNYSKCWFTENLRLDLSDTSVSINKNNTNHPTAMFINQASGHPEQSDENYVETNVEDIIFNTNNINRNLPSSYNNEETVSSDAKSWFSYGVYYNWYTATAGNGKFGADSTIPTNGDLCPNGWKIPTGNSNGEYSKLDIAIGGTGGTQESVEASNRWRKAPLNFVLSGFMYNSAVYQRSEYGAYHTITNNDSATFNDHGVYQQSVFPGTDRDYKYGGFSVRCMSQDPTYYTLSYDANGGEFSNGTPASQTSSILDNGSHVFTLSSVTPTKSGYTFIGWSDIDGVEAAPSSNYTATRETTVLYAKWSNNLCNPSATTIGTGNSTDAKCMQDMKGSIKTNMPSKTIYSLYDARDGKSYNVAKLDDDELWMVQNLNFGEDTDTLLTLSDTNLMNGSAFLAPASTTSFTTSSSVVNNSTPKILKNDTYGGYYSYAAATADTQVNSIQNKEIKTSICPFAWGLPSSAQYNNLKSLANLSSYSAANASPYNFTYAGYRNGSNYTSQTTAIRLWTSTIYSSTYAYYSTSYSNASYSSNYKRYGESVRCIFIRNVATVNYYGNGTSQNPVSGETASQTNVEISNSYISANGFSREGYKFTGWNTQADGTGDSVKAGTPLSSLNLSDGDTLNLYAQWGEIHTVMYDINTNDANASGNMTNVKHINVTKNDTFDLFASNYSRQNYGFAGWSTNPNAVVNNDNYTIYGPNEGITATDSFIAAANNNNEIVLYAVWVPIQKDANGDDMSLQTEDLLLAELQDGTTLASKPVGYVTALKDERDGEVYTVAKLEDGNFWMIENLRLDTAATHQANSASLSQGYDDGFLGLADPETVTFRAITDSNTFNGEDLYTLSVILAKNSNTTYQAYRFPRYDNRNTANRNADPHSINNVKSEDSHADLSTNIYLYGNYYSWPAIIASIDNHTESTAQPTSLCPSGWALPAVSGQGSYAYLDTKITDENGNPGTGYTDVTVAASKRWRRFPNNFILSGVNMSAYDEHVSIQFGRGGTAYYWINSTVSGDYDSARIFQMTHKSVLLDVGYYKFAGVSARCTLAKNPTIIQYTAGVESISIDGTTIGDGETVLLDNIGTHQLSVTLKPGYSLSSWSITSGSVSNYSATTTNLTITSASSTSIVKANTYFSGTYIQNLSPSSCDFNLKTVFDNRDMHQYSIKRMADGRCWMIDNLDLGRTDLTKNLTSSNTNISSTVTAATFNSWKKTSGSATYDAGEFIPIEGTDSTTGTAYGTAYNYYAASAGTITGNENSSNANYDICPAGWRLPTGGTNGEFKKLYQNPMYNTPYYMHAAILDGGAAFAYAGGFSNSTPLQQGNNGSYWASTYETSTNMHRLYVDSSMVFADMGVSRNISGAIRCVLKETVISDLQYLQDFRNLTEAQLVSVAASMEENKVYNLVDNRDNKTYGIARMKDNRIWMAENLDLGRTTLSTDLTNANTNLSTTVTASTFNGWKQTSGNGSYSDGIFIPISGEDPTSETNYGTLYNYHAASAGTITGNANSNYATNDICPAGWRLPTSDSSGEFQNLYNNYYTTSALMRTPVAQGGMALATAGSFRNGSPGDQGDTGYYWSLTWSNDTEMYGLTINNSTVLPSRSMARNAGLSIRCVVKKTPRAVTIVYGEGVIDVTVNGVSVANNSTIYMEPGLTYILKMTQALGYSVGTWSTNSGTVTSIDDQTAYYTMTNYSYVRITAYGGNFTGDNMQNLSPSNCTSTPKAVKDTRDNKVYIIQRLADGNCWMMENLDLGRTNLTTDLTSSNTNIAATVTASTFNSWKKTTGTNTYNAGEFISVSGTDSTSGTAYGTLYNYYAASAGTITGTTNSINAQYDICPAGWRLPTGYNGEQQVLYLYHYNSNALMRASIINNGAAFALAGYFNSSYPSNQGAYGYYWSSTRGGNETMYRMSLNTETVWTNIGTERRSGYSIRCILKEPKTISKLTYLQDFNNLSADDKTTVLSSMEYNTIYSLIDTRDNKSYGIAKMKDGMVWMAENLDLGRTSLTTNLTSNNTNISTSVPAATFNSWLTTSAVGTNDNGEFITIDGTDETSGTAYGTIYNFYAASAGTVSGSSHIANADYDICPAGWRLPTGGPYGEIYNLYTIPDYNSPTLYRTAITSGGAGFSLPGVAYSGAPEYTSYFGSYWTSTTASSTLVHRASMNKSSVGADGSDNRSPLGSIRCVAKITDKTISDYTYMQNFRTLTTETKAKLLSSMADNTNYTLIDTRDNASYTVAKLKDGNIWMTRNLDLGRTDISVNLMSTNTNIDVPSVSAATFNGWRKTTGSRTYTDGEFISSPNTTYGTFYNYHAASAGTITGTTNSNNASYDLCPAGWRLPTGGNSGEQKALYSNNAYNSSALMRTPIENGGAAFSLGGYFYSGGIEGQDSVSYYWSSTRYNDSIMYYMVISTSSVTPVDTGNRNGGFAMRCIAK